MGSNKYTVMFIPESEKGTTSYHFSKNLYLFIISTLSIIFLCGLGIMICFVTKISDYSLIKERHKQKCQNGLKDKIVQSAKLKIQ